jgi:excisionase family DNA binding protein
MGADVIVQREILAYHVARRLNVSVRTVRWWAETGRLAARREGVKIWKFRERDVEAFQAFRALEVEHAR